MSVTSWSELGGIALSCLRFRTQSKIFFALSFSIYALSSVFNWIG